MLRATPKSLVLLYVGDELDKTPLARERAQGYAETGISDGGAWGASTCACSARPRLVSVGLRIERSARVDETTGGVPVMRRA